MMPNSSDFPLILDHLSMLVSANAPEAQTLTALGLHDSGRVVPQGALGLSSRFFYFHNTYLELFWVHDLIAAETSLNPLGVEVQVRQAWRETGACPFGVMLQRQSTTPASLPFPTHPLHVQRLGQEIVFEFSAERWREPYYAVVPDVLGFKASTVQPPHALGMKKLTQAKLVTQAENLSATAQLLVQAQVVVIELGQEPVMELTFDDGQQGQRLDVRPTLPLVLCF